MIDDLDDEWGFCECGVVLDTAESKLCSVCAAAPHDRECLCSECDDYWRDVHERSILAGERLREKRG